MMSKTAANCPVYNPIVKRVKPRSSKREPTIRCSEESMRYLPLLTKKSSGSFKDISVKSGAKSSKLSV